MADVFYQITAEGKVGTESVANVFWYKATGESNADPLPAGLIAAVTNVSAVLSPLLRAILPEDYTLVQWRCQALQADGTPGTAIPVTLVDGGVGSEGSARDGNAQVAIAHASLGTYTQLVTGASLLRRGYWAIGPIASGAITDDGAFVVGAYGGWDDLMAGLAQVVDLSLSPHYHPIKVSFTHGHIVGPNMTAYREVLDVFASPQASFRRSRTNKR